jgi:glycosyltransferase involved in cell wall biosynthesis
MKLSILIPIYNFNVKELVTALVVQASEINIVYEIICIDDFSKEKFHIKNIELKTLKNFSYLRLNKNIGRSKIRNLLVEKAKFEDCLILDCDVKIISDAFLKEIIFSYRANSVIVGGHKYQEDSPTNPKKCLHWKYGKKREVRSLKSRKKAPYISFKTNCFLTQKSILNTIRFDESIQFYGHEDTLFGFSLESHNIPIIHIDNPVLHEGLDEVDLYLKKQREAIKNLVLLTKKGKINDKEKSNIKILQFTNRSFLKLYSYFYLGLIKKLVKTNLYSENPSLKALALWKLGVLSEIEFAI